MTLFWIIVAGLTVLAMAFFILPLLRNREVDSLSSDELNLSVFNQQIEELDNDLAVGNLDQQRYDAARRDLEKELLVDVSGNQVEETTASSQSGRWLMSLAVMIPMLALLLYQMIGNPEIIPRLEANPLAQQSPSKPHGQSTQDLPPMEELVDKLAAKLQQQPANTEGWIMLGRSYEAMAQPDQAIGAYERGLSFNKEHPGLMLAYAEGLAKQAGNDFTGKPATLIQKAHQLEPNNPNALWMIGIVSYQQDNYQGAIDYWEQLTDMLGPQSKELASVDEAINDARKQLGLGPELPAIVQADVQPEAVIKTAQAAAPSAAVDGSAIQVQVELSPELQAKTKSSDTVFIYAKATSGPPMPLAAARKQVKDLPLTLILNDNMAMMPQMKLSGFQEVAVGARVSISGGGPMAQSGDLEGEIRPVAPGQSETVIVVIDSVHP